MSAFGWSALTGSGNNVFGGMFASWYVNDTGSTVYIDQITLLNVVSFPHTTPTASVALYSDDDNTHFPGRLLATVAAQTVVVGSNGWLLSSPISIGPGQAIWVAAFFSDQVVFSGSGTVDVRLSTAPGGSWTDPWHAVGVAKLVLPAILSGSSTGPGDPTHLRVPLNYNEPLTEGTPSLLSNLVYNEPLTEGTPAIRTDLVYNESLTEGTDSLRCSLIWIEALAPVEPEGHMSTDLFPELPGLTYSVFVTPTFSTKIASAVSGKQNRTSYMKYPIWKFKLSYDYLPDRAAGVTDLKNMVGFFCKRGGAFDTFLYNNPDDNAVTAQAIGTGDGTVLQFPILRTYGGFDEPVGQLNTSLTYTFYKNTVAMTEGVDYDITMPNQLVFPSAPDIGDVITWTGSFYYVCHFSNDSTEFEKFMDKLWQLQECDFESVV